MPGMQVMGSPNTGQQQVGGPPSAPNQNDKFRYSSNFIVMAAGQHRELRPYVAPELLQKGGCEFILETELPAGLHCDRLTGTIWGIPAPPAADADPAGPYQTCTVSMSNSAGNWSTSIGVKIVDIKPQDFRITSVSEVKNNMYMVVIDAKRT